MTGFVDGALAADGTVVLAAVVVSDPECEELVVSLVTEVKLQI